MSGCKGLHCDGCGHGGAGGAGAVAALLVIIALAARQAWPHVVHAVEVIAWIIAGTTGAAITVTGAVLARRALARRRALASRHRPPVIVLTADEVQAAFDHRPGWPGRGEIERGGGVPRWPGAGWTPAEPARRPQIGGDHDDRDSR
jgi:hypothetical protein